MIQNNPPNGPGSDDHGNNDFQGGGRRDDPSVDSPYFTRQSSPPPDLDAGAPVLRTTEMQRLNRKALMFLAGIVLLLMLMAFWLVKLVSGGSEEDAPVVKQENVAVPDAPTIVAAPPVVQEPAPEIPVFDTVPDDPVLPPDQGAYPPPPPSEPSGPTLLDRRMANGAEVEGGAPTPSVSAEGSAANEDATSARFINNPDTLLVRGTYLRCVLESRIVTDLEGYASCILTEPVYSINGRRLLLPRGSKLLGQYGAQSHQSARVAIIWDRVTTPNGIDVSMASPGIDLMGSAGHPGDYNAHWASRITTALLISLISDAFKYAGEKNGPRSSVQYGNGVVVDQPYQSNTAKTVQDLAEQAIQQSANRPATITINQGSVLNVYVSKDIDFSRVVAQR